MELAALVLSLIFLVSLAGVIYPFRPFRKRSRALWTVLATFVAIGAVSASIEAPRSETAKSASTTAFDESSSTTSNDTIEVSASEQNTAEEVRSMWVVSDRLNRRTCASTRCGVVGVLFFRERVDVLEEKDGWVRITKQYDGACTNGQSTYVDNGNAVCQPENGIVEGKFAEWVSVDHLSGVEPDDPSKTARGFETIVAQSDDFATYRTEFAEAAENLISQAKCTKSDFREMGGWVKSTEFKNGPVYFTYCGKGYTKFYVNVSTGRVYQ